MTGFGRAEARDTRVVVVVEVRSVNHRHLEVALRLPRSLSSCELEARRLVQGRVERGRVDISVQAVPAAGESLQSVRIDRALARVWLSEARALARDLELAEAVAVPWLLERPGVARLEEVEGTEATLAWSTLSHALGAALDALMATRTAEGEALRGELRAQQAALRATVARMAERAPAAVARRTQRLRERVQGLLGNTTLDEGRIATEVAIWAERTDITEELVRLGAHLDQFSAALDKGGPVGRLFDFLLQEMNREVNTVGAKSDDLELSQAVIAAKGLLEKMREQVQNLE